MRSDREGKSREWTEIFRIFAEIFAEVMMDMVAEVVAEIMAENVSEKGVECRIAECRKVQKRGEGKGWEWAEKLRISVEMIAEMMAEVMAEMMAEIVAEKIIKSENQWSAEREQWSRKKNNIVRKAELEGVWKINGVGNLKKGVMK